MTQHTSELDRAIAERLEPWTGRLGADRKAYFHHVLRVLRSADLLFARSGEPGPPPSAREEFRTAATFHDLGIWAAATFDYLEPSCALAGDWLIAHNREDIAELVAEMIRDHHRVRSAGKATDPVELFRRADLIDVTFGARRYGLPYAAYSALMRRYPDSGFHFKLVELTVRRALIHPLSPLPMIRW
ncbi:MULTISPECIES: hypothetical protein [Nocardia]|uniref:hypothetical protein n=1 Tax=Nocardia TaxID=1817 RepID=UPI0026587F4D|nr:hypothetical protein [Nocardia sp. PE-7]WKG10719.1 hypothetical protein QX204_04295 [Nocardia sp. PE-7]